MISPFICFQIKLLASHISWMMMLMGNRMVFWLCYRHQTGSLHRVFGKMKDACFNTILVKINGIIFFPFKKKWEFRILTVTTLIETPALALWSFFVWKYRENARFKWHSAKFSFFSFTDCVYAKVYECVFVSMGGSFLTFCATAHVSHRWKVGRKIWEEILLLNDFGQHDITA